MEKKNKEEKKSVESPEQQKLTYEQLEQVAGNLNNQCRQLYAQLKEAQTVIAEFNEIEILLSVLAKSMYFESAFVDRCAAKVQDVINGMLDKTEENKEQEKE